MHVTESDERYTESETTESGDQTVVVDTPFGKLGLAICYDLRFPELYRLYGKADAEILINIANWPGKRIMHWNHLLKARAIENLCYVIGLNRVGYDGMGNYFSGDSAVIHPSGKAIVEETKKECIIRANLSKDELGEWRKVFQFYKDRDEFEIKI